MGFGDAALYMLGWLVMLPVLAICMPIYRLLRRWEGSVGAKLAALALLGVTIAIPLRASFRWIPEPQAKEQARVILWREGRQNVEISHAERTADGWTVFVPKGNIRLSRSGDFLGSSSYR